MKHLQTILLTLLFGTKLLFGAIPLNPNSLQYNAFAYISQPRDPRTHLLALGGYRMYRPTTTRFLKQDSYSPFLGNRTLNRFNYAAGNPILKIDNTGHAPESMIDFLHRENEGLRLECARLKQAHLQIRSEYTQLYRQNLRFSTQLREQAVELEAKDELLVSLGAQFEVLSDVWLNLFRPSTIIRL